MSKHGHMFRAHGRSLIGIGLVLTCLLSLYRTSHADTSGPGTRPAGLPPGAFASRQRTAPHPLADVTTIVEADVSNVSNVYDQRLGPRTVIELSNIVTHVGKPLPGKVFSQLGGVLPDGSRVEVRELPQFTVGARYILFFSRQASVYTPVWARLAFRIERMAGKEIVLGPDGTPVLSLGVEGIKFGRTRLLADEPDHSSKTSGRAFLRNVAQADADAAVAIGPKEFVSHAEQAAVTVGAPIGESVTLEPDPSERWDFTPTSPQ